MLLLVASAGISDEWDADGAFSGSSELFVLILRTLAMAESMLLLVADVVAVEVLSICLLSLGAGGASSAGSGLTS